MDAKRVRTDFLHEVQRKQWGKKWAGARVERVGLLYDVTAEDAEANTIEVVDVAHDQRERWARDQFLAIGLKVVQAAPREAVEVESPILATGTPAEVEGAARRGLAGVLGRLLGKS